MSARYTETISKCNETLTPEAKKAIEAVHELAIDVLDRTHGVPKYVCESNVGGLLDYAEQLEKALVALREVKTFIRRTYTPIKRVTTVDLTKNRRKR